MLVPEQMCHVGECICHQPKATYCTSNAQQQGANEETHLWCWLNLVILT